MSATKRASKKPFKMGTLGNCRKSWKNVKKRSTSTCLTGGFSSVCMSYDPAFRVHKSPAAVVWNGRILLGGDDAENQATSIVDEYDPASDKWYSGSLLGGVLCNPDQKKAYRGVLSPISQHFEKMNKSITFHINQSHLDFEGYLLHVKCNFGISQASSPSTRSLPSEGH